MVIVSSLVQENRHFNVAVCLYLVCLNHSPSEIALVKTAQLAPKKPRFRFSAVLTKKTRFSVAVSVTALTTTTIIIIINIIGIHCLVQNVVMYIFSNYLEQYLVVQISFATPDLLLV